MVRTITCEKCGVTLSVPANVAGKTLRCSKCGHRFALEGGADAEALPDGGEGGREGGHEGGREAAGKVPGKGPPLAAPAAPHWHVLLANGAAGGPFTADQVRGMIRAGQVGPDTQLWTQGSPSWEPAATFPELAAYLPASGTPRVGVSAPPVYLPGVLPPAFSLPGVLPAAARVSLTRVCLACGYQGAMGKGYPAWMIILMILLFPIGLVLLAFKKFRCPQCGSFQD